MPAIHNLFDTKRKRTTFDLSSCNIVFVTFGDEKFKNSRERIVKEAKNLGFFNKCHYETEDIVNELEFKNALKNREFNDIFSMSRGFGYWLWKPYVIYKNLKSLNEGDILVYSDAGSSFPKNPILKCWAKTLFFEYFNIIRNNKGCICFSNNYTEYKWTKGEVFDYFDCCNNEDFLNSNQIESGFHVIRKCDFTTSVYNKWWTIAKEKPGLFDDCISRFENNKDFCENRHDQSVWSLICKKMNITVNDKRPAKRPIRHTRIRS